MTRLDLIADGFRSMCASRDLHRFGWQVRYWFRPADCAMAIEYHSRFLKPPISFVALDYDQQVEFHTMHGLNIVPPGEQWEPTEVNTSQPWLF